MSEEKVPYTNAIILTHEQEQLVTSKLLTLLLSDAQFFDSVEEFDAVMTTFKFFVDIDTADEADERFKPVRDKLNGKK
jgi:hypothetical protein